MIIKGDTQRKCWNCGKLTFNISLSFETAMCSEQCDNQKWREYESELKRLEENNAFDSIF